MDRIREGAESYRNFVRNNGGDISDYDLEEMIHYLTYTALPHAAKVKALVEEAEKAHLLRPSKHYEYPEECDLCTALNAVKEMISQ